MRLLTTKDLAFIKDQARKKLEFFNECQSLSDGKRLQEKDHLALAYLDGVLDFLTKEGVVSEPVSNLVDQSIIQQDSNIQEDDYENV